MEGGVISPLLANIYLDPLDWLMAQNGLEMVRYADGMVVMCRDAEKARGALETIAAKLNPVLLGWYGYFKHAQASLLEEMDGWERGRLRGILRKRRKGRGRARGRDHHRWQNRCFAPPWALQP